MGKTKCILTGRKKCVVWLSVYLNKNAYVAIQRVTEGD